MNKSSVQAKSNEDDVEDDDPWAGLNFTIDNETGM